MTEEEMKKLRDDIIKALNNGGADAGPTDGEEADAILAQLHGVDFALTIELL